MPVQMNMDKNSAPKDKPAKLAKNPSQIPPQALIIAGVLGVLFLFFMVKTFVMSPSVKVAERIAPPAGYPDTFPYNTKDWQDANKAGRAGRLSGVPPMIPADAGKPVGQ